MTRVPERALSIARRTAAYFIRGDPDEASAAAAARVMLEGGALGNEWYFGADGSSVVADSLGAALELLVASVQAPSQANGLRPFVERIERGGPCTQIIFAPPEPGRWIDEVAALARRRPGRMRVLVGVDGIAPPGRRRWWHGLLVATRDSRTVAGERVRAVVEALGKAHCRVTVVDRLSGRVSVAGQGLNALVVRSDAAGRRAGLRGRASAMARTDANA